jgi:hypothetical protein
MWNPIPYVREQMTLMREHEARWRGLPSPTLAERARALDALRRAAAGDRADLRRELDALRAIDPATWPRVRLPDCEHVWEHVPGQQPDPNAAQAICRRCGTSQLSITIGELAPGEAVAIELSLGSPEAGPSRS